MKCPAHFFGQILPEITCETVGANNKSKIRSVCKAPRLGNSKEFSVKTL